MAIVSASHNIYKWVSDDTIIISYLTIVIRVWLIFGAFERTPNRPKFIIEKATP